MFDTARSFLASHQDASELVERAQKFSVRLPFVGQVGVPPPDQLAFYGVLGVLATVGAIDWPVAAAIGVGQAVLARRFTDAPPDAEPPAGAPAVKAAVEKAPARKAPAKKVSKNTATRRS